LSKIRYKLCAYYSKIMIVTIFLNNKTINRYFRFIATIKTLMWGKSVNCNLTSYFTPINLTTISHGTKLSSLRQWHQRSISPRFYKQLLRPCVPKLQKDTDDLTIVFLLFVKAARKMLVKSTPDFSQKIGFSIVM